MSSSTTGRIYYPALDSLRGVAILLVLLHHYFYRFQIGWVGVDLFFVLSGFLITDILLKDTFSKNSIIRFYIKRALRIIPVYYSALALFLVLGSFLFSEKGVHSAYYYYNSNQLWFWSFLQNWLFIKKGPPPDPYLTPFWSLAVEWQFYLVWPFVLHFANKYNVLKKTILFLICVSLLVRVGVYLQHPNDVENYYYNSVCRMDSLLIGSFLAVYLSKGKTINLRLRWIFIGSGLVLLLVCGFVYKNMNNDNILMATIGYTLLALSFASVLYWFVTAPIKVSPWARPLHFMGKISYSIYIYHLPIYLTVASKLPVLVSKFTPVNAIMPYLILITSFVLTLMISAASFYFIELPILRFKRRWDKQLLHKNRVFSYIYATGR